MSRITNCFIDTVIFSWCYCWFPWYGMVVIIHLHITFLLVHSHIWNYISFTMLYLSHLFFHIYFIHVTSNHCCTSNFLTVSNNCKSFSKNFLLCHHFSVLTWCGVYIHGYYNRWYLANIFICHGGSSYYMTIILLSLLQQNVFFSQSEILSPMMLESDGWNWANLIHNAPSGM